MKKSKTKDLIEVLRTVMKAHTKHYQSDFDSDVEILTKAAQEAGRTKPEDRTFLWMARTSGTWCLLEKNVYMKDSRENHTWNFYATMPKGEILAYRVEVTGMKDDSITGTILELNYQKHSRYIQDVAVPSSQTRYIFENGERIQPNGKNINTLNIPIGDDPVLGELKTFHPVPDDPNRLAELLRKAGNDKNWNRRKDS